MRKILAILLIAVMALSLSSCGETKKDDPKPEEKITIGFCGSEYANPWIASLGQGVKDACEERGYEFIYYDAKSDANTQFDAVKDCIDKGCNGIVMNAIDGESLTEMLNAATEKGIVSISVAQPVPAATHEIKLDDASYGMYIASNAIQWINENLDGKANIVVLAEDNIDSSINRGDAIVDTLKQYCPNSTIITRIQANTPEQGLDVVSKLLKEHPEINVVVACNDSGAIGAFQAFEQAGISTDPKRAIFAGDNTEEARELIKQPGSCYRGTVDLYPYESGYRAVQLISNYLSNGLPTEHQVDPLGMNPLTQEQMLTHWE